MKKAFIVLSSFILIIWLFCCGGGTNNGGGKESGDQNLTPVLTSLSPSSRAEHMPSFTLKATGSKFVSGSKIVFGGVEKDTTYNSSTELICKITTTDITPAILALFKDTAALLQQDTTVTVFIRNPSGQGGDSSSLTFTILTNPEFDNAVNISKTSNLNSNRPAIAVDSTDNIHVVWDEGANSRNVYYSNSNDEGKNWKSPVIISQDLGMYPDITVDSNDNMNVVWTDNTAYNDGLKFSRSTDGGKNWSAAVKIPSTDFESVYPAIAADSAGNLYIVWEESANSEIYFSCSTNNGSTWSQLQNLSNNTGFSHKPRVTTYNNEDIYVVWQDSTTGIEEIYLLRSTDSGLTWSQAKNISNSSARSYRPDIKTESDGSVDVVYGENGEIYFKRSTDNGANWSAAVNVSNSNYSSGSPRIAVDSIDNLNVIWAENISGYERVYYSRSIDNGSTWTSFVDVYKNANDTSDQAFALDSLGNINVVFGEWTPMNNIYFAGSKR